MNIEEIKKLKLKTLVISARDESLEWIRGGSRKSMLLLKINRKTLAPNEILIITVHVGMRLRKGDNNYYYNLYSIQEPRAPLRRKKIHLYAFETMVRGIYFEWIIQVPKKAGNYKYRVVRKFNSPPSFDDYDIGQKVDFEITIK